MRKGTVCFLIRKDEVLLIRIEYSPTDQKWTGIGGMVEEGETLEDSLLREVKEESYIILNKNHIKKVAELNGEKFQLSIFLADEWSGELKAKEASLKEFKWFNKNKLPFSEMHPGNDQWLPRILNGEVLI